MSKFIGDVTATSLTIGTDSNKFYCPTSNIGIGQNVFKDLTTGKRNVCIGVEAGSTLQTEQSNIIFTEGTNTTTKLTNNNGNTDSYYDNMYISFTATTDAAKKKITAYNNTTKLITFEALDNSETPSSGTATIFKTNTSITTGTENTFIGHYSAGVIDKSNQSSFGNGAICTDKNQITLGNSNVDTLRCADAQIATLSDLRDKTNIVDSPYGLDFIDTLRPVQYKWERRKLVDGDENCNKNGKTRVGFIAQELQAAMPNNENEILDLVYDVNPERIEAKYGNLIPIITKAIQELNEKIKILENK